MTLVPGLAKKKSLSFVFQSMGLATSGNFIISYNLCFICSWSWWPWPVTLWMLNHTEMHSHPRGGLFPATGNIHLREAWVFLTDSLWMRRDVSSNFQNHWVTSGYSSCSFMCGNPFEPRERRDIEPFLSRPVWSPLSLHVLCQALHAKLLHSIIYIML